MNKPSSESPHKEVSSTPQVGRPGEAQRISREAVKVLAIAVGSIREAARRMGLPEERVLKWSQRDPNGPWISKAQANTTPINPATKPSPQLVLKPAQALENTLAARKNRTRVNLSRYLVNASQVASRSRKPLEDAPLVDKVANVMTKLWPDQKEQASGPLNLNLLGGRALIQINQTNPNP